MRQFGIAAVLLLSAALFALPLGCSSGNPSHKPENSCSILKPLDNEEDFVIGDAKTRIYHRPDCPLVGKIRKDNIIKFIGADSAQGSFYKPCPDCLPGESHTEPDSKE